MSQYQTQNIELCAKDEEIAQLKDELSQEMTTTQRLHSELMESAEEGFKKDAEIERLKAKIKCLEKLNLMTDDEVILDLKAELERLKALLTRAADALKPYEWGFPDGDQIRELIAELRKAAE